MKKNTRRITISVGLFLSLFSQFYLYMKFIKLLKYEIFGGIYISLSIGVMLIFIVCMYFIHIVHNTRFFRYFLQLFSIIKLTNYLTSLLFILLDIFKFLLIFLNEIANVINGNIQLITQIDTISLILAKTVFILFIFIIIMFIWGILFGYKKFIVTNTEIFISKLPEELDGLKIGHISDIHCGSILIKSAIEKGINILLNQKADIIFFTGDLVNMCSTEVVPYINILKKITAPLGVYSVLGNHDYGYYLGKSKNCLKENLKQMKDMHKQLGWNLLIDEHKIISFNNQKFPILGVQNWSKNSFYSFGNLDKAYKGTEKYPIKLLLSHDPSHWKQEIVKKYQDINVTFSGHTHGSQIGIFTKRFKWSLVKYKYKEWAGLYSHGNQYLYVNKGFGSTFYSGRIGMNPEISIIELKKKK